MSNVITMYECGRCGEVHRSEYSAEEAIACCGGEEEAPLLNPRELEAAGQLNWLWEISA